MLLLILLKTSADPSHSVRSFRYSFKNKFWNYYRLLNMEGSKDSCKSYVITMPQEEHWNLNFFIVLFRHSKLLVKTMERLWSWCNIIKKVYLIKRPLSICQWKTSHMQCNSVGIPVQRRLHMSVRIIIWQGQCYVAVEQKRHTNSLNGIQLKVGIWRITCMVVDSDMCHWNMSNKPFINCKPQQHVIISSSMSAQIGIVCL